MIHLLVAMALYFLPTIIASHRGHDTTGIGVLNLLLGWTGIGWIVLLVWALSLPNLYCAYGPYGYGYDYRYRRGWWW